MTGFEFSAHAKSLLKKYYMREGEDNPKDAFRRASYFYARDSHLAERIYGYACRGWFMFSSPILSNAGEKGCRSVAFLLLFLTR